MEKNEEFQLEPILVKNPLTGRYVNVAPMFSIIGEVFDNDIKDVSNAVDKAIRTMCLHSEPDKCGTHEFKDNLFVLYQVRDIFNLMAEFNNKK